MTPKCKSNLLQTRRSSSNFYVSCHTIVYMYICWLAEKMQALQLSTYDWQWHTSRQYIFITVLNANAPFQPPFFSLCPAACASINPMECRFTVSLCGWPESGECELFVSCFSWSWSKCVVSDMITFLWCVPCLSMSKPVVLVSVCVLLFANNRNGDTKLTAWFHYLT